MKPVKVACVGTNGHQILRLLEGLASAQLVGVAEMDVVPGVARFDSLEHLLRDSDCELVSLCSARRDWQAGQILACLESGRHVLAEKPLCTSIEDVPTILAAAARANRKVWAMLGMLSAPILKEFSRRIRAGEIGEVAQVYAQKSYKFGGNRPQDRGVDGGIIQAAIHAVSFVRATTGLEFVELSAQEGSIGNDKAGNLQVEFALTARLSNGALCQITTNYLNPACAPWWGNDQLRIFGTRGMMEAVDGFTRAAFYVGETVERREVASDCPSYLPALFEEIVTGKASCFSMEDSLRCTQIVIEAQLSASAGGLVRKLNFVG